MPEIKKFRTMISQETADVMEEDGIRIPDAEVVTPQEANTADYIAVWRWTDPPIMPDNIRSSCSKCGAMTQERPTNPPKPKRVCNICVADLVATKH